jgi:DNA-binding response OmpR family regulator
MIVPPAVLVVEDEPSIGSLVRAYLERAGLEAEWVRSGGEALRRVDADPPALIVLDLGLPDLDGLEIARRVTPGIAVIALTARGDEPQRLAGFAAGVDDYVPKPFSPRELSARVRAVLRRTGALSDELTLGAVSLSVSAHRVTVDGRAIELTGREFSLLEHLLRHAGHVLTRDRLLEEVWGFRAPGETRTVDVHVAQLRAKLGVDGLIRTVRGVGYVAEP